MNLNKHDKTRMIRSIMGDIAHENIGAIARDEVLDAAVARLPDAVRALWNNPDLRGYVATSNYNTNCGKISGLIPTDKNQWLNLRDLVEVIGAEAVERLKDRCAEVRKQDEDRDTIQRTLEANFATVRTAKVFRERFPELAKYLPTYSVPTANLPATTDLVDRLKAAGLQLEAEGN